MFAQRDSVASPASRRLIAAMMLVAGAARPAHTQVAPAHLGHFLQENIGFDARELSAVEHGEAVLKSMPTQDRRDVTLVGIIAISATREAYTTRLRDFQSWLPRPSRAHFGVFSDPPVPGDVKTLTLDPRGIDDLKKCQPHECDIKLPAVEMQKFRELIDAAPADALASITQYAKQRLVTYVAGYRLHGDSALAVYEDEKLSVRAADAFDALVAPSPYVYQELPSLTRYLTTFPRMKLDSLTDATYWSEDVAPRLRPIISATQVVVLAPADLQVTLLASKQIYADHYFEGAFELVTVIERPGVPGETPEGSYLLVLRKYRFDSMPSSRFIDLRGRVVGGLRDVLLADLRREKAAVEKGLSK